MTPSRVSPTHPIARVVLLGASNLRLGRSILVQLALERLGGPLEFYVADGFGRSYGNWSSIPGRALPGITQCELWNDLQQSPSLPTFAMLTDVGNDLLYRATPDQLANWVEECVTRLGSLGAQTLITELPISSILATSRGRFGVFRTIFFPPSRLSFEEACHLAHQTNHRLSALADARGCARFAMAKSWYGIDPIHVRRRFRRAAWKAMIDAWLPLAAERRSHVLSLKNSVSVKLARPRHWRLLGREGVHEQPCVTLDDGSTVAVY